VPAWQGAKAPRKDNGIFDRIIEIFQAFATQPGTSASAHKNVKLFLREPLGLGPIGRPDLLDVWKISLIFQTV
jgi:hypothetical protein